jgi:hypothetical protein
MDVGPGLRSFEFMNLNLFHLMHCDGRIFGKVCEEHILLPYQLLLLFQCP